MNVRGAASATALAALASCVHASTVERAYGGHVVEGASIEPQAYAAFLRGAMSEADGDLPTALSAYGEAARIDEDSPEIWARIGEVTCRGNARDPKADAAFARALKAAPGFPCAEAARSRCLLARGDTTGAEASARRAAEADPGADGANLLLATAPRKAGDAATRAVLVGLTLTAREPLVAWDALAKWAEGEGDVPLWSRALQEVVRIVPSRRDAVARAAELLAGTGHPSEALAVAAAAADAGVGPLGDGYPVAARLALDEAIARASVGDVQSRATRVRLSLDEAAGRALLAGERTMARKLAAELAGADPGALGARLVLAATAQDPLSVGEGRPGLAPVPSAAFVAFGAALLRATSPARASAMLRRIVHAPVVEGDERVVGPAVELVARGALPVEELPPDGIVELAARRGDPVPDALVVARANPLDARHEYLALALARPDSARARTLGAQLEAADASDPIVAAAATIMRLSSGAASADAAAKALLARDAGDPLLVATALHVAEKVGDHDVARRAREALMALGGGGLRAVE
jgi:hypothetical protein